MPAGASNGSLPGVQMFMTKLAGFAVVLQSHGTPMPCAATSASVSVPGCSSPTTT